MPEDGQVPRTRDQAITLLQKLGYRDADLSPEERAAIRALYRLDDDRPVSVWGGEPR
jgi:hypothetical protein